MNTCIAVSCALAALVTLTLGEGAGTPDASAQAQWLSFNGKLIRSRLEEPRGAVVSKAFIAPANGRLVSCVCGEIDEAGDGGRAARHQRFISCGSGAQMLEAEVDASAMQASWDAVCTPQAHESPLFAAGR